MDELDRSRVEKASGLTRAQLADALELTFDETNQLERDAGQLLGTLRRFIEAMNGELILVARFPDGVEVPITLSE